MKKWMMPIGLIVVICILTASVAKRNFGFKLKMKMICYG
jgi:hypothetical protein